jgi:hypothetical protein
MSAWHASCSRAEAALLGAALLCVVSPVRGQSPAPAPLVVVVSNDPDVPFVRRLAAELSLFGYRVEVRAPAVAVTDLDALLASSGGAALIAVDERRQTAEIVVGERAGAGAARHERERLDPRRRADTNAAVLAERFRARLTELGILPVSTAPSVAAPPSFVVPASPPPLDPEPRLWAAGALGATSGGLGLMPDAELELRAFPVSWLSTSAFGKLSFFSATVARDEGEAEVRVSSGGVLIDLYPVRRDWTLKLGVGVLLVNASMRGRAEAPFDGENDAVLVPAGMLEAGAGVRLSPRVAVELRAFVGGCAPRVGVRFAGQTVARYGQPFLGASLGLAVGVF